MRWAVARTLCSMTRPPSSLLAPRIALHLRSSTRSRMCAEHTCVDVEWVWECKCVYVWVCQVYVCVWVCGSVSAKCMRVCVWVCQVCGYACEYACEVCKCVGVYRCRCRCV